MITPSYRINWKAYVPSRTLANSSLPSNPVWFTLARLGDHFQNTKAIP